MLVMQLRVASCGKVRRASSGPSSFEQLLCSYVCAWAALVLIVTTCMHTDKLFILCDKQCKVYKMSHGSITCKVLEYQMSELHNKIALSISYYTTYPVN